MNIKPYVWSPLGNADWSMLVFATNRQEAKVLGHKARPDDPDLDAYLDIRVHAIKPTDEIMQEAVSDLPHVVDSPTSCEECFMWPLSECVCAEVGL